MIEYYSDKYEEIVGRVLQEITSRTDISQLLPGAKARAFIEAVSKEIANAYSVFSNDLMQSFLKYASGTNLDLLGEMLGVVRRTATRNEVVASNEVQKFYVESGTFGDINGGANITIPAGTLVYTYIKTPDDKEINYVTTSATSCLAANSEVYTSVRAQEFGASSNVGAGTLRLHNFENYTDYLNDTLKTINIEGIAFADTFESDTNFRYRISNQIFAIESSNATAIRLAALTVPGVADVVLDWHSRGIGSGAVYIKAITPTVSDFTIAQVQSKIDAVCAFGNFVEAKKPKEVGIELEVNINLYDRVEEDVRLDLISRVKDRLYEYINSLDINETLYSDRLIKIILDTDPNIKSCGTTNAPFAELSIWKETPAEDNRVKSSALGGYVPLNFERVVVEFTELPDGDDPIRIYIPNI